MIKYYEIFEKWTVFKELDALNKQLFYACDIGDLKDIKKLLSQGANIHTRDDDGGVLLNAIQNNSYNVVKYLVEQGADVNDVDDCGNTPLHVAVDDNKFVWVKYLVEHGADINVMDESGYTPLYSAINNDNFNMVKYLVDQGANINIKCDDEPLLIKSFNFQNRITLYLIENGADVNVKSEDSASTLMMTSNKKIMKILIEKGVDVNAEDKYGDTTFSYNEGEWDDYDIQKAIMNNYPNGYRILKENNIEIHPKIKQEYPEESIPDELGFFEGFKESEELIDLCKVAPDLKKIKELVENGADVNFKDKLNNTVLSWACSCDNLEVVKYLIKKGADINNTDKNGSTPIIVAAYNHLTKIVQYLIEQGADVSVIDNDNDSCFDNRNLIDFWSSYEIQKLLIKKDMKNIYLLSKHGISIHPKIKQEYPEEIIVDELGFFN